MDNKQVAMLIAETLEGKKAEEITIINIGEKSSFADYMVLASGGSERQIATLSDHVIDALEEAKQEVKSVEGRKESGWLLLDCGDIIVNVFTREMREKYSIEKLWGDCEKIILEDRNDKEI